MLALSRWYLAFERGECSGVGDESTLRACGVKAVGVGVTVGGGVGAAVAITGVVGAPADDAAATAAPVDSGVSWSYAACASR